jgi:hypothetical protein
MHMTISKEIMEKLDTSYLRPDKEFVKRGVTKIEKHLGVHRSQVEVVGHSWEFRKGQSKGETTTLFGREKCDTVFPPKVIAVLHVIAIDGKRRQVPVNDLSVKLPPDATEDDIPVYKKVQAVNDGRKYFKVGRSVPVKSDVWGDGYVETYFDNREYKKLETARKKKEAEKKAAVKNAVAKKEPEIQA